MSDIAPLNNPEWVPSAALDALSAEQSLNMDNPDAETPAEYAHRMLDEWAPAVALSMIHLALYSLDERLRLTAGRYLLDRSLGSPRTAPELVDPTNSAFRQILDGVVVVQQETTQSNGPQAA